MTQWRQKANLGSSGVGASGSRRRSVREGLVLGWLGERGEIEMVGFSATALARTSEPLEGELEGKVMVRL